MALMQMSSIEEAIHCLMVTKWNLLLFFPLLDTILLLLLVATLLYLQLCIHKQIISSMW